MLEPLEVESLHCFISLVVLDNPTSGQVIVDGQNLSHMPDEELTIFRRRNIGFVFQQYNLVPMLNVWENIVLPVKLDGKKIRKRLCK